MTLLRTQLGNTLRGHRLRQRRTLREVAGSARVSLGYLSEVERGQKEASSELLAAICQALGLRLADLLREVSDELAQVEPVIRIAETVPHTVPVNVPVALPALEPVGSDAPTLEVRNLAGAVAAA